MRSSSGTNWPSPLTARRFLRGPPQRRESHPSAREYAGDRRPSSRTRDVGMRRRRIGSWVSLPGGTAGLSEVRRFSPSSPEAAGRQSPPNLALQRTPPAAAVLAYDWMSLGRVGPLSLVVRRLQKLGPSLSGFGEDGIIANAIDRALAPSKRTKVYRGNSRGDSVDRCRAHGNRPGHGESRPVRKSRLAQRHQCTSTTIPRRRRAEDSERSQGLGRGRCTITQSDDRRSCRIVASSHVHGASCLLVRPPNLGAAAAPAPPRRFLLRSSSSRRCGGR